MVMANVTINGQKLCVQAGRTVLEAAQGAGIDIPTLCHHPALDPIGACRVCLVEIKGQRTLHPACTFPVSEGMEIQTESPAVVQARKFVLDLLFSERNHYCMYCEISGDCELQNLGYRYGLDHWVYPTYTRSFPVDATRDHFLMDHNRCVLCRRCVRACGELVANHTLGMRERGAKTMINADGNVPFGDSSCISCGTCLQVCPTGSLVDRRSAFMGRNALTTRTKSACSQCSVGCGIEIVVRGGAVLRVEGDWDATPNGGLMCQKGRFDPLYDERTRVTRPLIRRNGNQEAASWDAALDLVAKRLRGGSGGQVGFLASSQLTNEAMYLVRRLARSRKDHAAVMLLDGGGPPALEPRGALADLSAADLILVVGADPLAEQPVASFLIKRAADKGIPLVVVDDDGNGLAPFATRSVGLGQVREAVELAARATAPAVVVGARLTADNAQVLRALKGATFVMMEPGANTRAAVSLGLDGCFDPAAADTLFVLLGEQRWEQQGRATAIAPATFTVALASYASALTERADAVLPMATWCERSGSLTNLEGRIVRAVQAVDVQGEARTDWEILARLADKLGLPVAPSADALSALALQELAR